MSVQEQLKKLEEAGERLGKAMGETTPEKREALKEIKGFVEEHAAKMASEGKFVDKSALFAWGIIFWSVTATDKFDESDPLIMAAKDYIDADYTFIKSYKEEK